MNLYEELRKKDSFSSVEKDVADYIVENGESILDMPIQQLAANTFTSTTTIIRLCKKLGFKGLIVIRYYLALRGAENGVTSMVTPFFCVQG